MSNPLKLTPIVAAADPAHGVSRRAALQALWGSVATGLVAPSAVAGQHPIQQHLLSPGAIEQAQRAAAAASGPAFLDAHQAKTLEVLAEAIVPGSTAAGVAPFLDQLLAVESADDQRAFLGSLGAFDMAAIKSTVRRGSRSQPLSRTRCCAKHRRPNRSRRFAATSRMSRTGLPAPTIHRSTACASSGGPVTRFILNCPGARTLAASGVAVSGSAIMQTTAFDVIVVGSGASGGWAAKRLSEAGIKVALLEAGKPQGDADFNEHVPAYDLTYRDRASDLIRRTRPVQRDCYACREWNYKWFVNDLEEPYTTPDGKPFSWQGRMRVVGGRTNVWGRQSVPVQRTGFHGRSFDGYGEDWPISLQRSGAVLRHRRGLRRDLGTGRERARAA